MKALSSSNMKLLDGRKVSEELLEKISGEVLAFKKQGHKLRLAVVLVGNDPASVLYVGQKEKACTRAGIESEIIKPAIEEVTTESMLALINELNLRKDVTGFIVQLPLPAHVNTPLVIKAIDPAKDVDGFNAYNLGKMFLSAEYEHLAPCTPKGVIRMLEYYNIVLKGKNVVMVGASNTVGKPLAIMLLNRGATVSICHIETKDLAHYTKYADIVLVAVGKINLITEDMIKADAIVVDIGINKNQEGKICGDSDFEKLKHKCAAITPVPGGVGPMTVACLIENTLIAFKRQQSISL